MKRSLLFVLFLCLSLAACGDRGANNDNGNVLHRGNGAEPESLDVHKSATTEAGHVQRDLGEGLVGYTPDGEIRMAAAASWSLSTDGKEYTFILRPEARWSNGDPVTAEDFVFSYRRLVDPATAATYTSPISSVVNAGAILEGSASVDSLGVSAPGDHELKITLTNPVPYFLDLLAHPSMFPVHPAAVGEFGGRYARPGNLVSNGAYKLVAWEVGSYIEIERNEHYWDNDNTSIDRVRHYVTPQPMVELNRYRAGELHVTRVIPPEMFQEMQTERPAETRVSPALGVYFYGFNMNAEPLASNQRLREALSMAIDRETIVSILGRGEKAAYNWVPNGTRNYEPQRYSWSSISDDARMRRAQEAYRDAGYGDQNPFATTIRYSTSDTHQNIAVAIQSMWADVLGVDATLINEEFQVSVSNIQEGNTEVFRLGWDGDYNDPHAFLSTLETGNSGNFTRYSDAEFDELMADAAVQTDPQARRLYLEEAERAMLRDYPLIPIYFMINRSMVSTRVSGWGDNVLNYHYSQHLSLTVDESSRR